MACLFTTTELYRNTKKYGNEKPNVRTATVTVLTSTAEMKLSRRSTVCRPRSLDSPLRKILLLLLHQDRIGFIIISSPCSTIYSRNCPAGLLTTLCRLRRRMASIHHGRALLIDAVALPHAQPALCCNNSFDQKSAGQTDVWVFLCWHLIGVLFKRNSQ